MKLKIGFASGDTESKNSVDTYQMEERSIAPKKSVVQVSFPGRGMALAYYNDQFDLRVGILSMWMESSKASAVESLK